MMQEMNQYNNDRRNSNIQNYHQAQGKSHFSTGPFQGKKQRVICEHCGYKGHTKETCYKIVGFPADFKSKRKSQNETFIKPQANNTVYEGESNGGKQVGTKHDSEKKLNVPRGYFIRVLYEQVLKMMNPTPTVSCKANVATCMYELRSKSNDIEWIVDSGASHHILILKKS